LVKVNAERITVTITPAQVLAEIPGWEDASISELKGGLSNVTWRVTKDGRSGVLKIDNEDRREPLNTRCAEAYVQNSAAKAGLAAKVILADDGFYFTEYVEGTVWARDCLDKDGNLEMIANALKRLHALPLTGRTFDAKIAARRYVEKASGLDSTTIETCTSIVSSMRLPHNLCCCHNDLVAENLITTPELIFLDWEYACDNDPFFDLATVVEHHQLSEEQTTRLLDTYLGGDGQRWREHLEKQRKLYLALLCLWMASQSNSDPAELTKVVERLSTNCS
jgi:thiamine kinase-like enzyme